MVSISFLQQLPCVLGKSILYFLSPRNGKTAGCVPTIPRTSCFSPFCFENGLSAHGVLNHTPILLPACASPGKDESIPLASSSKEKFPHLPKRNRYRELQKLVQSGVQLSDLLPCCPYKEDAVLAHCGNLRAGNEHSYRQH